MDASRLDQLSQEYGAGIRGLEEELKSKIRRAQARMPSGTPFAPALRISNYESMRAITQPEIADERVVVLQIGARPVAEIKDNKATTRFLGPASTVWKKVIEGASSALNKAIPAVGRIELENSETPWVGTGWLIAPGIVVTNRHVALEFVRSDPKTTTFSFMPGVAAGLVAPGIDFGDLERSHGGQAHPIASVLWIAPADEADVAFLRLDGTRGTAGLPEPIALADKDAIADATIAAIGYPNRASADQDKALVTRVFGSEVYDRKRLAPGRVKEVDGSTLKHDCSTLGGNSGSVLLDFATGQAVGLHRGGLLDDSANVGVPATYLTTLLQKALGGKPEITSHVPAAPPSSSGTPVFTPTIVVPSGGSGSYRITLNVPIEIVVNVGTPVEVVVSQPAAPPKADTFEAALNAARQQFGDDSDVLRVRDGFRFRNGWITDERVIVIEVREKQPLAALRAAAESPFPRDIQGIGIDVRTAALPDQLEALGVDPLLLLERPGKPAGYMEPPGYTNPTSAMYLGRVKERMDAVFHVSPDEGFVNLKGFFSRVKKNLTATMYEWEPNHVSDALEQAIKPKGRQLKMVTQKRGVGGVDATESAVEDMLNRLGPRKFSHVWASVQGPKRLIPTSYHIKVASRDGEEFWLSSGNWKDSNQPENPKMPSDLGKHNREWHAIVRNKRLATLFQKYIEFDFEQARKFPLEEREGVRIPDIEFFVPDVPGLDAESIRAVTYQDQLEIDNEELDIQPLLTPDRDADGRRLFMRTATEMIGRAKKKLYVQNQSFNFTEDNNEDFDEFFSTLKDKQKSIEDVRIIFRDASDYKRSADMVKQQELIERLKKFGLDVSTDAVRLQKKCHTKGIIVDTTEVLLGSQNLTNGGALFNRDASLLVRSDKVAGFYEKIFLYDWDNLAHNQADEKVGGIRRARAGEATPPGFRRVSLSELIDDD